MSGIPVSECLPKLADLGYDGLELAVGERYALAPDLTSPEERRKIRAAFTDRGLVLPALMALSSPALCDPDARRVMLDELRAVCRLAHEVWPHQTSPIITSTLGSENPPWDTERDAIVERLAEVAAVSAEEGCIYAIEPHVGGSLDEPEKAAWVVGQVGSPALRLNFDISHFAVQGMSIERCVPLLAPLAVHTHVKDGRMAEGKVQFLLPGEGDFDYPAYLRAMDEAGWTGAITVEVSGMVSSRPDYEPYAAAAFCLDTLQRAFEAAGIERN